MENCLSFDGAEGLQVQQQLYHYQSEVNAWRIKCSQLKMELESLLFSEARKSNVNL